MYTILMNNDKSLVASKRIDLYEGDNLADKIQFLFPQTYKDINLNECVIRINYIDLAGENIVETLIKDNELYKDKIRCVIPVDSELTLLYGDITFEVIFCLDIDGNFDLDVDSLFRTEQYTLSIIPHLTSIPPTEIIPENAAGKIIKKFQEDFDKVKNDVTDLKDYIDNQTVIQFNIWEADD